MWAFFVSFILIIRFLTRIKLQKTQSQNYETTKKALTLQCQFFLAKWAIYDYFL